MARRSYTEAEKRQLAESWLTARAHGESQEHFAARQQTTARRLREFVAEFAVPEPAARAREIVIDAIEQLRQLLLQIDATVAHVDAATSSTIVADDGASAPSSTRAAPSNEPLVPIAFGAPIGVGIESTRLPRSASASLEQATGPTAHAVAHDDGVTGAPDGGQVAMASSSSHGPACTPATLSGAPDGGVMPVGGGAASRSDGPKPFQFDMG